MSLELQRPWPSQPPGLDEVADGGAAILRAQQLVSERYHCKWFVLSGRGRIRAGDQGIVLGGQPTQLRVRATVKRSPKNDCAQAGCPARAQRDAVERDYTRADLRRALSSATIPSPSNARLVGSGAGTGVMSPGNDTLSVSDVNVNGLPAVSGLAKSSVSVV